MTDPTRAAALLADAADPSNRAALAQAEAEASALVDRARRDLAAAELQATATVCPVQRAAAGAVVARMRAELAAADELLADLRRALCARAH